VETGCVVITTDAARVRPKDDPLVRGDTVERPT